MPNASGIDRILTVPGRLWGGHWGLANTPMIRITRRAQGVSSYAPPEGSSASGVMDPPGLLLHPAYIHTPNSGSSGVLLHSCTSFTSDRGLSWPYTPPPLCNARRNICRPPRLDIRARHVPVPPWDYQGTTSLEDPRLFGASYSWSRLVISTYLPRRIKAHWVYLSNLSTRSLLLSCEFYPVVGTRSLL